MAKGGFSGGDGVTKGPVPTLKKMQSVLEQLDKDKWAVSRTMEILFGAATQKKVPRVDQVIAEGLAQDHIRRNGNTAHHKPHKKVAAAAHKTPTATTHFKPKVDIAAQRRRTAKQLAKFDTTKPTKPEGVTGLGPMVARGYLVKKGKEGYIRTDKPFSIKIPRTDAE